MMLNKRFMYVEEKLLVSEKEWFSSIAVKTCILTWGKKEESDASFYNVFEGGGEFASLLIELALRKADKKSVVVVHSNSFFLKRAKEEGFTCIGIGGPFEFVDAQYNSVDSLFQTYYNKTKRNGILSAVCAAISMLSIITVVALSQDPFYVVTGTLCFFVFVTLSIYFYPNRKFWSIMELLSDILMP